MATPPTPTVEAPSWQARIGPGLIAALALAVLAVVVRAGRFRRDRPRTVLSLAGIGLVAASLWRVEARLEPTQLRVLLGPWRLPVLRIDLDSITEAEALHSLPLRFLGLGVRYTPGALAVAVRAGETLRVATRSGTYLITVDGADDAAAAVRAACGLDAVSR